MSKIGDITIKVVTDESKQFRNEVTDKPIEDGAEIADHINHKPTELTFDFIVTGTDSEDMRDSLIEMSKADEVYTYVDVKNLRVYENMAILDVSFDDNSDLSNGFAGTMSLKQIKIANQQTGLVNLGVDPASGEQVQSNSGETESRDPGEEPVDEETQDSSVLSQLVGGGE